MVRLTRKYIEKLSSTVAKNLVVVIVAIFELDKYCLVFYKKLPFA